MRAVEELGVLVLESGTLRSGLRAEDGVLVPTDASEREFKAEWLSAWNGSGDPASLRSLRNVATRLGLRDDKYKTAQNLLKACFERVCCSIVPVRVVARPHVDGTQKQTTRATALRFMVIDPGIVSQWLVWSDELHCNVAVGHFHAREDEARADKAQARADRVERGLLDPELDADVYGGDAGEHDAVESSSDSLALADEIAALESARKVVEVVDGVAFAGKLAHLTARPTENPELLRAMQRMNAHLQPFHDPDDVPPLVRWQLVEMLQAADLNGRGRRYAQQASLARLDGKTRRAIAGHSCHDVDMRLCIPRIMYEMAKQCGMPIKEMPWLHKYVEEDGGREAFSNRVAYDYGVKPTLVKQLVNSVCNGGSVSTWAHEVNARAEMRGLKTSDVDEMRKDVIRVREVLATSDKFKKEYNDVRGMIERRANLRKELARAKNQSVNEDPNATRAAKEEAFEALRLKSLKAWPNAIEKSTFAIFLQTVENLALVQIHASLRANGWKARCLIYDGLLVEHRDDANIEHALRDAERAVASMLRIKIQLVEKPFYNGADSAPGLYAADAAAAARGDGSMDVEESDEESM